jgi:O-antigen/teichoic acid export membrane protein
VIIKEPRCQGRADRLQTLGWSAVENACRQLLSLGFFLVTARFLQPSDVGVFALSLAFASITQIFVNDMIPESLVQKPNITNTDWDTGFTLNLIIAVGFLILWLTISWPVSRMLGEPSLQLTLPVLATAGVIGAFGDVQKAFLARTLCFRVIAQTTLIGQIIGGVAGVVLAVFDFGYWSMIAALTITTAVGSVIYWWQSSWKPKLRIERATIESRFSYAAYVAAIRTIYLLRDQSPLIIAGLLVDLTQIGLLSLALRIARSMGQLFEEVTSRPLLSLVSREQHDIVQFGNVLAEVLTLVGMVAIPGYSALAIIGPLALPLVFGQKWAMAGTYLPLVCAALGGWLLLHVAVVSLRARSLGRTAVALTAAAVSVDMVIIAVLAPFGLRLALMGWAARNVLSVPISIYIFQTRLGVSARTLMTRWAAPLVATALMAGTLGGLDRHGLSHGLKGVATMCGAAILTYMVVMAIVSHGAKK